MILKLKIIFFNFLLYLAIQIYGTNFLTFSYSSELFGPLTSCTILPSKAKIIFGLVVFISKAGFLSSSNFSTSTRMMSTLFSNSSITAVWRFLKHGSSAVQGPDQAGWRSIINNFLLCSLKYVKKWSWSLMTVVNYVFFFILSIKVSF